MSYHRLTHLEWLESESIHIMQEVAAECQNPVLLFSGGKDSIVMLRLAEKAFRPGRFPFPLLHINTGHNFSEVIEFRDCRAAKLGERLMVRSVQDSIDRGQIKVKSIDQSHNPMQTVMLFDAFREFGLRVLRRRAPGQGKGAHQRAHLLVPGRVWPVESLKSAPRTLESLNTHANPGEHMRVFPIMDRAGCLAIHRPGGSGGIQPIFRPQV